MNRSGSSATPDRLVLLLSAMLLALGAVPTRGETNVYATRFEATQGYNGAWTLVGQQEWLGEGTGGNGIVTNFFAGQGQQAYIGSFPPESTNETELVVWRPINFSPLAAGLPVVKFSVLMSIVDSSIEAWDNFRWSFYNNQTNRLFSLDFDNYYLYRDVAYLLDGDNEWVFTPVTFTSGQPCQLTVTMDFSLNQWSATLDTQLIATNQPITTVNAPLTLGEIDALWLIYDQEFPGDNYMLFDNFQITAESQAPPRPRLELMGRTGDGQTLLRLNGQSGSRFAIDVTTNFTAWTALRTNVTSGGYYDHIDASATAAPRRFYRGRWVP